MTDAQFQAWLETSGKFRCALCELTFLGAAVGSPSESQEYKAYVSNMPYVTRATDTPANTVFEDCVIEVPSFTRRMGEALQGRSTQSYGNLIIGNENNIRGDWLKMNWDGRRIRQWLGDPAWPFSDFRLMLDGIMVDIFDEGANKIGFAISDKAALLDRPIMTTLLGGDGPDADKLMPLALGNLIRNATPKLTDVTNRFYKITAVDYSGIVERLREDAEIDVREDGNSLRLSHSNVTANDPTTDEFTSAGHGFFVDSRLEFFDVGSGLPAPLSAMPTQYWVIASGLAVDTFKISATRGGSTLDITGTMSGDMGCSVHNWTMSYPDGGFWVAGNPSGLITCTTWGLRTSGAFSVMYSPGDLMQEVLTSSLTNTPFTSADIDATNFATLKALIGVGKQVSNYLTEQTTFADLFDQLMTSVGGWWGFSRDGLLQIGRVDLPLGSPSAPVYSFISDDVAQRTMKLSRRILPRAEIKLLADNNWTVQSVFAGVVTQYDRGIYSKPGIEYTGAAAVTSWETDPTNHRNVSRPEPAKTVLTSGGQSEADRRAALFQYPLAIFSFQTHQAVYLFDIGDELGIAHPKYNGPAIVIGIVERVKGRSEIQFFCRPNEVHPTANI